MKKTTLKKDDFIFIREDRKQVKVFYDNILYIESVKDYIKIHLSNKTRLIKYSLTAFEDRLDERFIRTHRSYIVNRDKITAYTKQDIEIDAIEIPIGENYKMNISDL
ncbi:LytR/AlgR family response regulator transcription factor [Aquimarina spinulae]|uniref:LytR/AlgR family response regulator transcription factor n=1 Tax=Aquimarina spinulae TaxID=1192023 RepID=UPI0020C5829A|nr:LytTR family DNA-binding domain-containing protein [Aquimarina spinulae]